MKNFLFSYDDICLHPEYSSLSSRANADTSVNFLGRKWNLPVIPANMQDVISWEIAAKLVYNDYFYIMHRFNNANQHLHEWKNTFDNANFISISVGINNDSKRDLEQLLFVPHVITIDVAHAHHQKVAEMIKWLQSFYKNYNTPQIITGNVATADGYKFLCDLGVDAVKVGIGGGSICTTRYKTGFHIPTAYSIWDCATNGNRNVPIIADGGAKHYGDIAKALVLGADMVMSGRWFAECIDSPAQISNGNKVYRGSTSYESKGHNKHIEGTSILISEGSTYADKLKEITQALQSSISYAGGSDLSAFRKTKWSLIRN